jgi:hypothetical protein
MDEQQIMNMAKENMREVAQQAEQAHDQVLQALHDGGINVSSEEYRVIQQKSINDLCFWKKVG